MYVSLTWITWLSQKDNRIYRTQKSLPGVYAKWIWLVCASTTFSRGGSAVSMCCTRTIRLWLLEAVVITCSCKPWKTSAANLQVEEFAWVLSFVAIKSQQNHKYDFKDKIRKRNTMSFLEEKLRRGRGIKLHQLDNWRI